MKVPLLDLQLQYASIRGEVLSALTRVCDSQQFIMGSEVEALEGELTAALGFRHAIGVSSNAQLTTEQQVYVVAAIGDFLA